MQSSQRTRLLTYLLFFLSGISGLIYQIVWTRLLVLVFGNTLFATSTVLSSFMAGLAAGSYFLGKWIDRRPRRLLIVYAALEAAIGLFALGFPLFLNAATPLYLGLYRLFEGDLLFLNVFRFAVCFVLIFIPTFMMGGTLPVLIKRFVRGEETIGGQTGLLYGLNTAGAVAGTLACGYLLLRTLGMQKTTWIAVAINLGVAVFAWLLARAELGAEAAPEQSRVEPGTASSPVSRSTPTSARTVLLGIGISGFCALAYEVFWIRMLNLFINNNVYSFTAILATFLTGIALGSLLYASLLRGYRHPVWLFAGLQCGIGLISLATPLLFSLFQDVLFSKRSEVLTLAKTSMIMLAPTILMGMAVPLAVQICQRGASREGTSVGNVYAVNTIGAIFGALVAGFLLLPVAGLQRGLLVVAGLNLFAGLVAALSMLRTKGKWVAVVSYAAIVAIAAALTPQTAFRALYERALPEAEILHYEEGKVANVVVYDLVKDGWKDLYLNGVEEASSRIWHVQLFKMLGILPPMMHPKAEDALMIAFGAGMSAGACVNQMGSLDCVDLNPDIQEVAEIFKHENLDVLGHPGFNLIENDGRNTLLLSERPYSLIISDATNPKSFDSWTLYTREFYQLVQDRLRPDGVFCQWVVIPLTGNSIKVLLATFRSVFPHASLWCIYGSSQCMMLATPERLEIDYQELTDRLEPALETSGLREFGVPSVEKFLSFFLLGEDGLAQVLDGFDVINTDDLPIAQFRIEGRAEGILTTASLVRHQESIVPYLTNLPADSANRLATLDAYREIARRLHWSYLIGSNLEAQAARRFAQLKDLPEDANVSSALRFDSERKKYFQNRLVQEPDDVNALNSLAQVYWMEGELEAAARNLDRAIALNPEFAIAHFNLGRVLRDAGQYDDASKAFVEARDLSPTSAMLARTGRQLHILDLQRKLNFEPTDLTLRNALLRAYLNDDDLLKAEAVSRGSVIIDRRNEENLRFLASLYEQLDLLEESVAVHERLAELRPTDVENRRKLEELKTTLDDPEKRQGWLNRNKQLRVADESDTTSDHPFACEQARRIWNDAPFHARIGPDQLRSTATLLEEVTERSPSHLHAYVDAGRIYEILGDYDAAVGVLQRGLGESPDGEKMAIILSRVSLLRDLENGEVPQTAGALIEAGSLYRRSGEHEKAIEVLVRATEVEPANRQAWLSLASVYDETGRYERTVVALERALELGLTPTQAQQVTQRLGELHGAVANRSGTS